MGIGPVVSETTWRDDPMRDDRFVVRSRHVARPAPHPHARDRRPHPFERGRRRSVARVRGRGARALLDRADRPRDAGRGVRLLEGSAERAVWTLRNPDPTLRLRRTVKPERTNRARGWPRAPAHSGWAPRR